SSSGTRTSRRRRSTRTSPSSGSARSTRRPIRGPGRDGRAGSGGRKGDAGTPRYTLGMSEGASPADDRPATFLQRRRRVLIGRPRDLLDQSIFHRIALIPLLAWVGLGADGLSSSAYGPEEAFLALNEHRHLALVLALLTAVTVVVISTAYSFIIEEFP